MNPVEVLPFRHLKNVRFPSEILALPHEQIDTFLLTPKEAAASNGHLEIVQVLYHVSCSNEEKLPLKTFGVLKKAVLVAAKLVWEVFTESAANGHVEVLKFMMGIEEMKPHMKHYEGNALSRAITSQHAHVVDFLLEKPEFDWNWMDAFEEAVALGQTATTKQIYMVYPPFRKNGSLFVDLAFCGRKDAVEYLYNNGRREPDLRVSNLAVLKLLYENEAIPDSSIVAAFSRAARCESNEDDEVVKCLYLNKSIASDTIDKAFVSAVGENRTDVRAVIEDDIALLKMIVKCLTADNVPREYKLKAFLYAAKLRQTRALETIVGAESWDWRIDELKAALSVAWSPNVEQFIRKMIRNQLFRGKP